MSAKRVWRKKLETEGTNRRGHSQTVDTMVLRDGQERRVMRIRLNGDKASLVTMKMLNCVCPPLYNCINRAVLNRSVALGKTPAVLVLHPIVRKLPTVLRELKDIARRCKVTMVLVPVNRKASQVQRTKRACKSLEVVLLAAERSKASELLADD
ncbi:hypothetical protein BTUL_0255g00040 [Botrytis tulipae]|uniref:Uncharacterized protein n=1 Tax=Botrytis tulipae TaxID=87230 RepID=A0A4Z1EAW1_9HELO|nr:hypothetical protein BTUL_0255g00040 [Botrytis tulipae]